MKIPLGAGGHCSSEYMDWVWDRLLFRMVSLFCYWADLLKRFFKNWFGRIFIIFIFYFVIIYFIIFI
jgi:hypothetical protein